MGYYVRFLKYRKSQPNWKIQFISCKITDQRPETKAKAPKRTWDIGKERWSSLGFHPSMSVLEVRARAKQLNSQLRLKRQEEQLQEIKEKRLGFLTRHEAMLPDTFVAEFEERFVRARGNLTEEQRRRRNKQRYTTWRAAQKVIVTVGLEPSQWFFHNEHFYDVMFQSQFSIGYAQAILNIVNLWGQFISRKLSQPFSPIRRPQGYERQRILEGFYQKQSLCPQRRPSNPIAPEQLEKVRGIMNPKNFNWLFISVWFGLRPLEIDQLNDDSMWTLEVLPTGRKLLWVYQTKIIALPREDRWKPIPILYDEQHFALKIIKDKNFRRPLTRVCFQFG